MNVYYQKPYMGETYCCSLTKAKNIFNGTIIKLNFGNLIRKYIPLSNEIGYSYFKKNIKGLVAAKLLIENETSAMLSFYPVNKNIFSPVLKDNFEGEILNNILDFYNDYISMNTQSNNNELLLVELLNNTLIIHKTIIKV